MKRENIKNTNNYIKNTLSGSYEMVTHICSRTVFKRLKISFIVVWPFMKFSLIIVCILILSVFFLNKNTVIVFFRDTFVEFLSLILKLNSVWKCIFFHFKYGSKWICHMLHWKFIALKKYVNMFNSWVYVVAAPSRIRPMSASMARVRQERERPDGAGMYIDIHKVPDWSCTWNENWSILLLIWKCYPSI